MLVVAAIVLGVLCGWASGGRLGRLFEREITGAQLLIGALVVHVVTTIVGVGDPRLASLVLPVWALTLGLTAAIAVRNASAPGFLTVFVGSVANLVVVLANKGMPVSSWAAEAALGDGRAVVAALQDPDGLHVAASEATRFVLLADIAIVPGPDFLRMAVSMGDVLVVVGVAAIILDGMTHRAEPKA